MSNQYEGHQHDKLSQKVENLSNNMIDSAVDIIAAGTIFYRVQDAYHDGNGVYFNSNGEGTRYGISDEGKGTIYVSEDPVTCLAEVLKGTEYISERDLQTYHMATLVAEKELKVVDLGKLLPKMRTTVHDMTSDDYKITQALASKLASRSDGVSYVSNRTSTPCLALWDKAPSGDNSIKTSEVKSLAKLSYQGRDAETLLYDDLGIGVLGD